MYVTQLHLLLFLVTRLQDISAVGGGGDDDVDDVGDGITVYNLTGLSTVTLGERINLDCLVTGSDASNTELYFMREVDGKNRTLCHVIHTESDCPVLRNDTDYQCVCGSPRQRLSRRKYTMTVKSVRERDKTRWYCGSFNTSWSSPKILKLVDAKFRLTGTSRAVLGKSTTLTCTVKGAKAQDDFQLSFARENDVPCNVTASCKNETTQGYYCSCVSQINQDERFLKNYTLTIERIETEDEGHWYCGWKDLWSDFLELKVDNNVVLNNTTEIFENSSVNVEDEREIFLSRESLFLAVSTFLCGLVSVALIICVVCVLKKRKTQHKDEMLVLNESTQQCEHAVMVENDIYISLTNTDRNVAVMEDDNICESSTCSDPVCDFNK